MKWIGARQARWAAREQGEPGSSRAGSPENLLVDHLLRTAIRGEVAGATPRNDAWERLQRRLVAGTAAVPAVAPRPRSRAERWLGGPGPLAGAMVGRFSQLGVAALFCLILLSQPRLLDRDPPGQVLATPVAEVSAGVRLAAPVARMNRAEQAIAVPDSPIAGAVPAPAAAEDLVPPGPTMLSNGGPDGLGLPTRTGRRAPGAAPEKELLPRTGRPE